MLRLPSGRWQAGVSGRERFKDAESVENDSCQTQAPHRPADYGVLGFREHAFAAVGEDRLPGARADDSHVVIGKKGLAIEAPAPRPGYRTPGAGPDVIGTKRTARRRRTNSSPPRCLSTVVSHCTSCS